MSRPRAGVTPHPRTLERMGLRKKVGVGEYADYSSTSEEEDLLISKP